MGGPFFNRVLAVLPVLALSGTPAAAGPVPNATLDTFVRWGNLLRDGVERLTEQMPIPDLTILTVEPVADTKSSGFGWRDDPIRHTNRFHSGTDFRADPGTPVLAAGDGVVSFAGRFAGYGNCVQIDHGGGVLTLYGHLRKIETKKGAAVTAGTRIGQVGSTGRATGPHLHFEVRLEGRPVDPVLAMTVAGLERESTFAGRIAAYALVPEVQSKMRDTIDEPRPERKGRAKRQQVLW